MAAQRKRRQDAADAREVQARWQKDEHERKRREQLATPTAFQLAEALVQKLEP